MSARKPCALYWVFSLVFSLISLALILIILLSGVGGHVVAEYLTIDTAEMSAPAKLSGSVLLKDLSAVAGQDWVGSDVNAESLGLAKTYSLNLLTACSQDDGSTTCGEPKIGSSFDPSSDLHLDGTSIQGSFSSSYSDELQAYSKVSTFLGVGYVVGALFTALSCLLIVVSRCFPKAIFGSQFFSGVAFLFLLASAIASVVKFLKLKDIFNNALGASGLQAQSSSKMFGLAFGAAGLTFAAFLLMFPLSRAARNLGKHGASRGFERKGSTMGIVTGGQGAAVPVRGFLQRVTTWNRHKYTQVEKQTPMIQHQNIAREDDRKGLIASVQDDDFSHDYVSDFAMEPFQKSKNGHSRNSSAAYGSHVNTSYEPRMPPAYDPPRL
ncbi:hypothetical protein AAE478_000483 [Parahypoxylon ruwenzoriense]